MFLAVDFVFLSFLEFLLDCDLLSFFEFLSDLEFFELSDFLFLSDFELSFEFLLFFEEDLASCVVEALVFFLAAVVPAGYRIPKAINSPQMKMGTFLRFIAAKLVKKIQTGV